MALSVAQVSPLNIVGTPGTSHTASLTSVADHETLVYAWGNRTDTSALTGVTDDSTIAYTSRGTTPSGGSQHSSIWDRQDVAADASLTVTGTTAGNVNSQNAALRIASDLGGSAYPIFHAAATPNRGEPSDGTNSTSHTSNAVTVTAASGVIVSAIITNNSQGSTPTATITKSGGSPVSATVLPAAIGGSRLFLIYGSFSEAGDYTVDATLAATAQSSMYVNAYTDDVGGDPAPTITDVDGDDTVTLEQQDIVTNVSDEDSETIEVRQGGFDYVLSGNAASADMPTIGATGPISAPHAGSATWAVINGDDEEDTISITITDETGTETYLIGTPNADPDLRLTASADAVAGDYVRISNVQGGTIDDVTVEDDLTWQAEEGVTSFDVQYWDSGDGTYGDRATQTVDDGEATLVEVPNVVGDAEATATSTLEGEGFAVSVSSDYSLSVSVGDVISQSPPGGSLAEEGSTVAIVVSLGAAAGSGGGLILMRRRGRR